MGQGDEYSRDAYNYELAYDSDDSDEFDYELHPEDWQDMYSGELLDGWMALRGYAEEHYMRLKAGFPDFVDLVLDPGRWYQSGDPELVPQIMWNLIKDLPIICDRIQAPNFYGWIKNYVEYI